MKFLFYGNILFFLGPKLAEKSVKFERKSIERLIDYLYDANFGPRGL